MCAGLTPDIDTCLRQGSRLSSWFSERILNPDRMCDWARGSCGSLFGEEGEKEKEKEKEKEYINKFRQINRKRLYNKPKILN